MRTALLLLLLWLIPPPGARGQSAADHFHDGARFYIAGEKPQALAAVTAGLEAAPGDPRLVALKQLIEEQDDEEQQSNDQSEENDSGQDEQQPDDQTGEQQEDEQESSDERENSEQSDEQQEQGAGSDEQQPTGEPEQRDEPSGQPPPVNPEELTPEQAEAILKALEQDEEKLLRQVQKMKANPRRVEKDW